MSPSQESTVAQVRNTQNSLKSTPSLPQNTLTALLDKAEGLEGTPTLILALRDFLRDIKPLPAKDKRVTDTACERLLAIFSAFAPLERLHERLDALEARNEAPVAAKLSYATVASLPPNPLSTPQPIRRLARTRPDEVSVRIARNSEAERRMQGTGEEVKNWVQRALQDSGVNGLQTADVQGVKPHRSGTKVVVRLKHEEDVHTIVKSAVQCSKALGDGAKISVPHFGVVIQDVPLYINPAAASNRINLHTKNPHLIPSPEAIVDMRWLVPKERLPPGRKTGSWVVILDDRQAADNLIDQSVKIQSLLLSARQYFTGPRQCRKCQSWGHLSYSCRALQVCAHCAGSHDGQDCPNQETKRCANCNGKHDSFFPQCPIRCAEAKQVQMAHAEADVYFSGKDFIFTPFSMV